MPSSTRGAGSATPPQQLEPSLELLRKDYVLVQAWKKTSSFIRYHNWFSDTLALDDASANLRSFIGELRERLQSPETWRSEPLRFVPAPKSQLWQVREGDWAPVDKSAASTGIRPLAHVDLADQVVATAFMLCLANRIETLQGDPRSPVNDPASRKLVASYGNRLFCDAIGSELHHRWGSAKLYRAYFQDYQTFLLRPKVLIESFPASERKCIITVHSDLRQFYDRVRPKLLSQAIDQLRNDGDDPNFYELGNSLLNWDWHSQDRGAIRLYAKQMGLDDFEKVALPQGPVASGFLANAVLLPFDKALHAAVGTEVIPGIRLEDACRYVDDLRIVVSLDSKRENLQPFIKTNIECWLNSVLNIEAPGLELSREKTRVVTLGGDDCPPIPQGLKMKRIQSAVSGGFDAVGGEEILDAIQGLVGGQDSSSVDDNKAWRFSPIPDVRDETVARFGAARYRTTFRSIRPLLDDYRIHEPQSESCELRPDIARSAAMRTQRELDEDARAFALRLIERWINDPSNVRLLRIGLDLWPDVELLREILALLRRFTVRSAPRGNPRRVAWYCLAEILRAGATETGLVADIESLPSGIDLRAYRQELRTEASRLVALRSRSIPWYLRQQALLFLAAFDPAAANVRSSRSRRETRRHWQLIRFLCGKGNRMNDSDFATLAVLARRAFVDREQAIDLVLRHLNPERMWELMQRDPSFLSEIIDANGDLFHLDDLVGRTREDLGLVQDVSDADGKSLASLVLGPHSNDLLRNELSLLRFALAFLEQWEKQPRPPSVITPGRIKLNVTSDPATQMIAQIDRLRILKSQTDSAGSIYEVPAWCEVKMRWRFQLGFLLRFILARHPDFTRPIRPANWKESESAYRSAESHWYQRIYGLYSGKPAFGDDWVPITDWMESFLLALLHWPGCRVLDGFEWIEQGIKVATSRIAKRVDELERRRGVATGTLILPLMVKRPTAAQTTRPLRACVVQTVMPTANQFQPGDLSLKDRAIRKEHRNHLSAALAAVGRLLVLRDTHTKREGRLDWLILPELAVHPKDVATHLIPFARAHRTIILTGLIYEEIVPGLPLINSALWVIPEWSDSHGLQIRTCRQGKEHLAPNEQNFNSGGANLLRGFRPCQWLIGYPWSSDEQSSPVWLTGSVCYDATDLRIAADLRDASDIFAIPALNKDVQTFDQMALALHYHMFQLVIVANNGQYGGSNAYWPQKFHYSRQVFHTHGQPQASISFLEIDDISDFLNRKQVVRSMPTTNVSWKYPPAGLT